MEKAVAPLVAALGILLICLGISFLQIKYGMRKIVNCDSFDNYRNAVEAYNHGYRKLDHNGNGVPCEKLL